MIELAPEDKIIFSGDWHGSATQSRNAVRFAAEKGAKVILQVGDFGIWEDDHRFIRRTNLYLTENDMVLYFVDGNHENFDKLYAIPLEEDGTRKIADRIFHLPRGFRWAWGGVSFMGLGGAASIDKFSRRKGESWWEEELLTEDDVQNAIAGGPVDVMITHDSPASAPNPICDDPIGQAGAATYFGGEALEICTEHRKTLQRVTDAVTPRVLIHGHYHRLMEGDYRHADGSNGYVLGLGEGRQPLSMCAALSSPMELAQLCLEVQSTLAGRLL